MKSHICNQVNTAICLNGEEYDPNIHNIGEHGIIEIRTKCSICNKIDWSNDDMVGLNVELNTNKG